VELHLVLLNVQQQYRETLPMDWLESTLESKQKNLNTNKIVLCYHTRDTNDYQRFLKNNNYYLLVTLVDHMWLL
jgi:hypothetical protein